ncbi:MAG: glycosyltransferase family 39 protein [Hyphomicrobiales bacterium]|nr:glycosyltransferase family 39 protein [Hyphomicrobiales bacterium]
MTATGPQERASRPDSGLSATSAFVAPIDVIWFAIIAAAVFQTQIGSLTQEVIDWDESTFILLATELARGHLPYTTLFDNKPPLMFAMLAAVIAVFGKSLLAVRLFGDFCVFVIAAAGYAIARRQARPLSAGGAALLLVAVFSYPSWLHTGTELPAAAFLMGGLWLLVSRSDRLWAAAIVGFLVALATLTRSNLGLVAVALGLFYLIAPFTKPGSAVPPLAAVAYTVGGLIPLGALIAVYAAEGQLALLKLGVVDVALSYAGEQRGAAGSFWELLRNWGRIAVRYRELLAVFVFLPALAGLGMMVGASGWQSSPGAAETKLDLPGSAVMTAATFLSMICGGASYAHYWMQILGFLMVFAAYGLEWLAGRRIVQAIALVAVTCGFTGALALATPTALRVMLHYDKVVRAYPIRRSAERIAAALRPGDAVWAQRAHLVYWYLDMAPPSRVLVHPDYISRPAIITPLERAGYVPAGELQRIINSEPAFTVLDNRGVPGFYPAETREKIVRLIAEKYALFSSIDTVNVYRRRDAAAE